VKQLLLVRHGQPDEGHALRPGDPPLHADGHAQARAVALRRLALEPIDRVVCSPQQRALDTAAPLARLLGLEAAVIEVWPNATATPRATVRLKRSAARSRIAGTSSWRRLRASSGLTPRCSAGPSSKPSPRC
jgi:phosphohistidine phosphatase SixA